MTAVATVADDTIAKNRKFTPPATETPITPTSVREAPNRAVSRATSFHLEYPDPRAIDLIGSVVILFVSAIVLGAVAGWYSRNIGATIQQTGSFQHKIYVTPRCRSSPGLPS